MCSLYNQSLKEIFQAINKIKQLNSSLNNPVEV